MIPGSPGIVVEWTTATEINTAGFNLYRSEFADGPFTQINVNLIRASSDPLHGAQYRYEDSDVVAGKTYYYKLEEVELNGAKTQHGPIQAVAVATPGMSAVALWVGVGALVVIGIGGLIAQKIRSQPVGSIREKPS